MRSGFHNCQIIVYERFKFQQKYIRHTKTEPYGPLEEKIKAVNRSFPWENRDVELSRKIVSNSYYNYVQRIQENHM